MTLTALRETIDDLLADAASYGDGPSVVDAHRELARLEAFVTKITARFEASGEWALVGARSAASYLATEAHLPLQEARRQVRLGRGLSEMPATAEAFEAGEVSSAHAHLLARVRNEQTMKYFERDEALLLEHARVLRFEEFVRLVSYWEQHADPEGSDERAERRRARRDVRLDASYEGMYFGKMVLDPVSGSIVRGELDRLEVELFEADFAEAKARLGRDPEHDELPRHHAQRRADALVEMATRSAGAQTDGRRPAPLFSVLVDLETLAGRVLELANGVVLAPGDLACWLERADLERAVFTPDKRVEVGRTSRLFTGATRRAIELRDRRCQHPYCDEPLGRCQVDHIVPYSKGGPTTQENGRLLCGFHNRLRNKRPPPAADPDD